MRARRNLHLLSVCTGCGLVLLGILAPGPTRPSVDAAQGDVPATATRRSELSEIAVLQTQVAALSTEVAMLRGAAGPLDGRLGGSRQAFRQVYGEPDEVTGDDQETFSIEDVGSVMVSYAGDRVVGIDIRAQDDAATGESDASVWTMEQARSVVNRFAPSDADLAESDGSTTNQQLVVVGTSDALMAESEGATSCPVPGADFTVRYTTPTADSVSEIALAVSGASAVTSPETTPVASVGGTTATISLGGTATVNGVRIQATRIDGDATGELPAADDQRLAAVELEIENRTGADLSYALQDFHMTDSDGREVLAACGGVEPAITAGTLAPGETLQGWVSFALPSDAEPARVTYLVGGVPTVRAVFKLT